MPNEPLVPELQQPRSMFSTWLGVVLLFLAFGLFVWVVIGALPRGDTYEAKRAAAREEKLAQLRKEANDTLTTYGWVNKSKGVVHVPIARAVQLTLVELADKKPRPAGPIATPEAVASASPSPQSSVTTAGASAPSIAATAPPQLRANTTPEPVSVEGPNSEIRGQPTGAANPAAAPPGTQPGASATPAASPPAGAAQPNPGQKKLPTPVTTSPGSSLPAAGATPR